MQLAAVKIDKPETVNLILGQTHFIKSVEDAIHEALVEPCRASSSGWRFAKRPATAWCDAREPTRR